MRGLPSILSFFHNEFNKFNHTRARTSTPILRLPDLNKGLTLPTDASNVSIGAVLM